MTIPCMERRRYGEEIYFPGATYPPGCLHESTVCIFHNTLWIAKEWLALPCNLVYLDYVNGCSGW